jgi:hypothetical protein
MAAGSALTAVGSVVLTQVNDASGLAVLVTGFVVFSLGLAKILNPAAAFLEKS